MHALSSIFLLVIPFLTFLIFVGVFAFFGLFILMMIFQEQECLDQILID